MVNEPEGRKDLTVEEFYADFKARYGDVLTAMGKDPPPPTMREALCVLLETHAMVRPLPKWKVVTLLYETGHKLSRDEVDAMLAELRAFGLIMEAADTVRWVPFKSASAYAMVEDARRRYFEEAARKRVRDDTLWNLEAGSPADKRLRRQSYEADAELLARLKANLPELRALLAEVNEPWCYEDGVYRYYHASFKVYDRLQPKTRAIAEALQRVWPEHALDESFMEIVREGTQSPHDLNKPKDLDRRTVESFLHSKYFLEMAVKYAQELEKPPMPFPSGWASLWTLYSPRQTPEERGEMIADIQQKSRLEAEGDESRSG